MNTLYAPIHPSSPWHLRLVWAPLDLNRPDTCTGPSLQAVHLDCSQGLSRDCSLAVHYKVRPLSQVNSSHVVGHDFKVWRGRRHLSPQASSLELILEVHALDLPWFELT